uniref:Uncharacterized protein n=1 Tax=Ditylenchus dipsaci TaxID=166011 RepID=A0A915EQE5_9BILA
MSWKSFFFIYMVYVTVSTWISNLEEMLLLEPPITPNKLLDHLLWAEKYHLKNLERTTMFRMEGSYKEAATKLVKTVIFQNTLSAGFQTRIIGCLKGKWANMNADRMYKSCAAGKKVLGIGARVVLAEDEELKTLCDLDLVKVCGEPTVLEKLP